MSSLSFCLSAWIDSTDLFLVLQGKLRIREVVIDETFVSNNARMSINPVLMNTEVTAARKQTLANPDVQLKNKSNETLFEYDLNHNPIVFKCRLYIIKALLFRSQDKSGKADPFIKILLNNDEIIDDVESRIYNTLEPVFGK